MNPPANQPNKLIHVRGKLHRVTLQMEPCQPLDGPVTKGPLIRLGYPLRRFTLEMKPCLHSIAVTFSIDPDLGLTAEAVFAKVRPILELMKSAGFAWDRANSSSEPGRITIKLVPTTKDAQDRLPEVRKALTPVVVDIAGVTKVEVTEHTVLET